jgi:hypothetical protein
VEGSSVVVSSTSESSGVLSRPSGTSNLLARFTFSPGLGKYEVLHRGHMYSPVSLFYRCSFMLSRLQ